MSKARCDGPKLGRNGVGVYLGPAAMRQQARHLVSTKAGHVLCVAHVCVDTAVKPFLRGLVNELSANPLPDTRDSTVDLVVHVLTDGLRAGDLIGAEIQQYFPGHCTFLVV